MDATRWPEIERVLDLALDRDAADWPALLDAECAGDPALRAAVERLLARYERTPSLLDAGAGAVAAALVRDLDELEGPHDPLPGQLLGAWRVVREVGRGGMSRVYLAERHGGEFAQRAAIKVLRAGLDTPADAARFHAERRILAALEHPYIARLLDGGVTPDGRPYLVLEYVDGVPLTTWCATRRLDVPARLRLMLSVAEATQAAHRRLVVHRDLKPSNILVDADGRPRLLDFGIAKILEPGEAGDTATRQRWLSPAYAAPEQFTGGAVTTATDVYQLGAILYEVLAGRRPFDDDAAARRTGPAEEPPPPSRANPALRGDFDAVIGRAMRPDPEARYASVAELAADLRRVLDDEPVAARAGDRAYRWGRALRRRALPLGLGVAALLVGVVYTATVTTQNRRISRALAEATTERAKAEQVTRFVLGLFAAGDPRGGRSDTVTARTLLARGEARADGLAGQPAVQAELLDVVGRIRATLGAHDVARPSLERALAIRRRQLGDDHPDVARSRLALAALAEREGRYDEAEREARAALATGRRQVGDTAALVHDALFQLGSVLHTSGRYRAADSAFTAWEAALARSARAADEGLAAQLHQYGEYVGARQLLTRSDEARAERILGQALAMRRAVLGASHTDVAFTEARLALEFSRGGRVAAGDSLMRRALAVLRQAYPEGHVDVASALERHGQLLLRSGRREEGIARYREALAMIDRLLGPGHLMAAAYATAWANALYEAGRPAEAEPALRMAAERFATHGAQGTMMRQVARASRGDVLRQLGRYAEAEAELTAVLTEVSAARGPGHRVAQRTLRLLATLYEAQGRPAEAARTRARLLPPVPPGEAR